MAGDSSTTATEGFLQYHEPNSRFFTFLYGFIIANL